MALFGSYNPQYPSELQTANATALNTASDVDTKVYTVSGLAVVTSADATPLAVMTFAPVDLKTSIIEIVTQAIKSDGTVAASYVNVVTMRRSGATTTQVGSTTALVTHEDTGSMACTVAASGANVVVTGTGVAATTIYWSSTATVRAIGYTGV